MNRFLQKLFLSKEGQKVLAFLAIVFLFGYSVLSGASNLSWQSFFDYVQNFASNNKSSSVDDNGKLIRVKRAVDGDTIELESGEKVRYIGINTPETVKPNSPVECFGKEASTKNKELVDGKLVRLKKDVSDKDKYGRLLRFVYLEDGTFVNDILVREGYAFVSTFPPDVAKADQFKQAEREARENVRGLWAQNTCNGEK